MIWYGKRYKIQVKNRRENKLNQCKSCKGVCVDFCEKTERKQIGAEANGTKNIKKKKFVKIYDHAVFGSNTK